MSNEKPEHLSQPAQAVTPQMNAVLAKYFADDPANACRAQAALTEILAAQPAQAEVRDADGCVPIHRTLLDKLATDMAAIDMPKIAAAIRRWVANHDAKATPAPDKEGDHPPGGVAHVHDAMGDRATHHKDKP